MRYYKFYIITAWLLIGGFFVVWYFTWIGKAFEYLKDVLFSVVLIGFSLLQFNYRKELQKLNDKLLVEQKNVDKLDAKKFANNPIHLLEAAIDLDKESTEPEINLIRTKFYIWVYSKAQIDLEGSVFVWGIMLLIITIVSFFLNLIH